MANTMTRNNRGGVSSVSRPTRVAGVSSPRPWGGARLGGLGSSGSEGTNTGSTAGTPSSPWWLTAGKPPQYDQSGNQLYPDWVSVEPWRGEGGPERWENLYEVTNPGGDRVGAVALLPSGEWSWSMQKYDQEAVQTELWGAPGGTPTLVAGDSGYAYTEPTGGKGTLVLGAINDAAARTGVSPEAFLKTYFGVDPYAPGGIPRLVEDYLRDNWKLYGGADQALSTLIIQIRDKAAEMAPAPSAGLAEETAPTPDLSTNFWSDVDLSAFAFTPTFDEDLGDAVSVAYNDIIGRAFGR